MPDISFTNKTIAILIRYHNIGELTEHPVKIEDGKIVLKYENGETCMDGVKKATTTIIMVCDQKSFVSIIHYIFILTLSDKIV